VACPFEERLKVSEAGGRPILVAADVSDEQAVDQMFDQVLSEYGRPDILVNNAGIQIAEDSDELSAADFDKVLAVNLRGAFLCARRAVRTFLAGERPGVIINVSSLCLRPRRPPVLAAPPPACACGQSPGSAGAES